MSQVTAYSQLYPLARGFLPGLTPDDNAQLLKAFQWAGRQLAATEAFRDWLEPIAITDYQQDYRLTGYHPYSAQVHRLLCVKVNGSTRDPDRYSLYQEKWLRFDRGAAPNNLDSRLLRCGTGLATMATWQAITAGSVTITLAGKTYLVPALNLSAATDMDDVALTIQTGFRTAIASDEGNVRWFWDQAAHTTGFFALWFTNGTTSYLTAGTSGTDISGASYMNGLTGGTGVSLGALLEVQVVFRPDERSETLPSWFVDRYADALIAGAIIWLATQPGTQRLNADVVAVKTREWHEALNDAIAEFLMNRDQKGDGIRIGA